MKRVALFVITFGFLNFSQAANEPKVGDLVFTKNGTAGEIVGVFSNGDVSVEYNEDGVFDRWSMNDLAVGYGCAENTKYCVNTRVVTENGNAAYVVGIFKGEFVLISYEIDEDVREKYSIYELALTIP